MFFVVPLLICFWNHSNFEGNVFGLFLFNFLPIFACSRKNERFKIPTTKFLVLNWSSQSSQTFASLSFPFELLVRQYFVLSFKLFSYSPSSCFCVYFFSSNSIQFTFITLLHSLMVRRNGSRMKSTNFRIILAKKKTEKIW